MHSRSKRPNIDSLEASVSVLTAMIQAVVQATGADTSTESTTVPTKDTAPPAGPSTQPVNIPEQPLSNTLAVHLYELQQTSDSRHARRAGSPAGTTAGGFLPMDPPTDAWLGTPRDAATYPSSTATANKMDPALNSQVVAILSMTAHQLQAMTDKGIEKFRYPHHYVLKGTKREQAAIGSLTISEHAWGITQMIQDQKTTDEDKRHLFSHLIQVLEDSIRYDWPVQIRNWSEELFTLEGQGTYHWGDTYQADILRLELSKRDPLSMNDPELTQHRSRTRQELPGKALRNGPPCSNYNQGRCSVTGNHISKGVKYPHICSYCLHNISMYRHHPEHECNIEEKYTNVKTAEELPRGAARRYIYVHCPDNMEYTIGLVY